jgi:hypothetical protein
MRSALIFMCGLGVLAAASATIEESRLGIRQSRSGTGIVKRSLVSRGSGFEARITSRAGLDETVGMNCPKAASNSGDGAATVQLADATH